MTHSVTPSFIERMNSRITSRLNIVMIIENKMVNFMWLSRFVIAAGLFVILLQFISHSKDCFPNGIKELSGNKTSYSIVLFLICLLILRSFLCISIKLQISDGNQLVWVIPYKRITNLPQRIWFGPQGIYCYTWKYWTL